MVSLYGWTQVDKFSSTRGGVQSSARPLRVSVIDRFAEPSFALEAGSFPGR